jgi:hypothetical protein
MQNIPFFFNCLTIAINVNGQISISPSEILEQLNQNKISWDDFAINARPKSLTRALGMKNETPASQIPVTCTVIPTL